MEKHNSRSKPSGEGRENDVKKQWGKHIVVFDLEGTLSNDSHRHMIWAQREYDTWNVLFQFDPPNIEALRLLVAYQMAGFKIVILTAKYFRYKNIVEDWLTKHLPPVTLDKLQIIMRPEDNDETSPDFKASVLLPEKEYIELVIDDRPDVCKQLRKEGISCLQYHGGNREYDFKKKDLR